MGRRGSMRGRPNFLFFTVFAVFLILFYLSWRSLMSPDVKVRDSISIKRHSLFDDSGKWKEKVKSSEKYVGGNRGQRPTYNFDSAVPKKKDNSAVLHKYESSIDEEEITSRTAGMKPHTPGVVSNKKQALNADSDEFYYEPNNLIIPALSSMERFVHLDLKGAAPKMTYLMSFIPLIKKLGATGLLIEYEDMFPYSGILEPVRAKNAYSMENIKELLRLAEVSDLRVMPLIQTFGHMEFVLKSEFRNYRESEYTPQVIDITKNVSYVLILEMIKQILSAHPNVTHLHIGCDEAYELGKGASTVVMQSKKLTESQIFLQHVQRVASIVRAQADNGVIPVIWDDELRKIQSSDLENSKLSSLVEIMVWQYSTNVPEFISKDVWNKYANVFKSVWIASSFKGTTGPRQIFTEPKHHLNNQYSWLNVIAKYHNQLKFKGVALIGWQRYDHFATLCELMPVAIPSLAVCLATMVNAGFTKIIHIAISKLINCNGLVELVAVPDIDFKRRKSDRKCVFPGHDIYYDVQVIHKYIASNSDVTNRLDGWLSDYQVAHGFSSPGQLKILSRSLEKQVLEYAILSISIRQKLAIVYSEDTVDEWIDENIRQTLRHINELQKKADKLQKLTSWKQHPLMPISDENINGSNVDSYENRNSSLFHAENGSNIHFISENGQDKFQNENGQAHKTQFSQSYEFVTQNLQNKHGIDQMKLSSNEIDKFKALFGVNDFEINGEKSVSHKDFNDKLKLPDQALRNNHKDDGNVKDKGSNDDKVLLLDGRNNKDNITEGKNISNIDKSSDNLNKQNEETKESTTQISTPAYSRAVQAPNSDRNFDNFPVELGSNLNKEKYEMGVKNKEMAQIEKLQSNSKFQESSDMRKPQTEAINHADINSYQQASHNKLELSNGIPVPMPIIDARALYNKRGNNEHELGSQINLENSFLRGRFGPQGDNYKNHNTDDKMSAYERKLLQDRVS